jgi:hypothetical protein
MRNLDISVKNVVCFGPSKTTIGKLMKERIELHYPGKNSSLANAATLSW